MQDMADWVELRALVDRYSTCVTVRDMEGVAAVFAEDAEWRVDPPFNLQFKGRAEIARGIAGALEPMKFTIQMAHSAEISIAGDQATLRCVVHEMARTRDDGGGLSLFGVYEDKAERRQGRWLFTQRRFRPILVDMQSPPGEAPPAYG